MQAAISPCELIAIAFTRAVCYKLCVRINTKLSCKIGIWLFVRKEKEII